MSNLNKSYNAHRGDTILSTAVSISEKTSRQKALERIRKMKAELNEKRIKQEQIRAEAESRYEAELLLMGRDLWAQADRKEKRLMAIAAFKDPLTQPKPWDEYSRADKLKLIQGVLYLHQRTTKLVQKINDHTKGQPIQ